jgi:hypothetical protein
MGGLLFKKYVLYFPRFLKDVSGTCETYAIVMFEAVNILHLI